MRLPLLGCNAVLLLLLNSVTSFMMNVGRGAFGGTVQLRAMIYGADYQEEFYGWEEPSASPASSLAESLTQNHVASLARLAVAHSPKEQPLHLKDIERVGVMQVDDHHVEIEAVVCEYDGCVTLAVPVEFPETCEGNSDHIEECIIENIDNLDIQAEKHIKEMEAMESDLMEFTDTWNQLLQPPDLTNLPVWWVAPGHLAEECFQLISTLNKDDFQSEMRELASRSLSESADDLLVERAAVVAVCPAGMFIRAKARDFSIMHGAGENKILELSIPFQKQAQDVDTLRDTILGVVTGQASNYSP